MPDKITLTQYSDILDIFPYLALYAILRWSFNFIFKEPVFKRVKETDPVNYNTK